jgi:hypothetical protein
MLGTYAEARWHPWLGARARRRRRAVTLSPTGRQALRHGIRGAAKATCLSALLMAAFGVAGGSHGPIVLSEPAQPGAAQLLLAPHLPLSAGLAAKVPAR